jgi:hypothetical protein
MAKRKGEGVARRKSEVVTVRLDPKLKYLAELAGRKHRRALSSYIEWATEQSLSRVLLEENSSGGVSVADAERKYSLWDLDEPDRVVRLALNYPELLTHEEQVVWKLIRENGLLWRGKFANWEEEWTWDIHERTLIWDQLRKHWKVFLDVARGALPSSALPTWQTKKPIPPMVKPRTSTKSFDIDLPS